MTILADPIPISPGSIVSFYIVVVTALIVETGIVSLLLAFRGIEPLGLFVGYLITNVSVYFLIFGWSLSTEPSAVPLKEILAVLLDALAIKLLVSFPIFHRDNYRNVTWRFALLVSCVGNTVSYFIGEVANHQHA